MHGATVGDVGEGNGAGRDHRGQRGETQSPEEAVSTSHLYSFARSASGFRVT